MNSYKWTIFFQICTNYGCPHLFVGFVILFFFSFVTSSLRKADAFPVVASLSPKNFSEGEKRRPKMRLLFAGYVTPYKGIGLIDIVLACAKVT